MTFIHLALLLPTLAALAGVAFYKRRPVVGWGFVTALLLLGFTGSPIKFTVDDEQKELEQQSLRHQTLPPRKEVPETSFEEKMRAQDLRNQQRMRKTHENIVLDSDD